MELNSKVYLSGPIGGVVDFRKRFYDKEMELIRMGIGFVVNPAEVISHMPYKFREDREGSMAMCYTMMSFCDTIYLMKGWQTADGCRKEKAWAEAHGMEVVYER